MIVQHRQKEKLIFSEKPDFLAVNQNTRLRHTIFETFVHVKHNGFLTHLRK